MHDLEEIRIFLIVARRMSFTAAAQEANLTLSAVSKKIARLEQRLGTQLLNRTTRSVSLTQAGSVFNEKCRHVLNLIGEAEADLRELGARPRGSIRINAPESFGRKCVAPVLSEFLATYPDITVELTTNSRVRKFEEGLDLVIRRGELKDERLGQEIIYVDHYVVCASPDYIANAPEPLTEPRRLQKHNCLLYKFPHVRNTWDFHFNGRITSVQVGGNLIGNDYDCVLQAAVRGLGVACLPSYVAQDELAAGRLVEIFPHSVIAERPMRAFYLKDPYAAAKVLPLIAFMKRRFAPYLPAADDGPAPAPLLKMA
jgi:DNA-binding transcriptional LysR family regulator